MGLIARIILAAVALLAIAFVVILPLYTIILAVVTILRAKWRARVNGSSSRNESNASSNGKLQPWSGINTSLFQGTVFHIRHQPMVHSFKYPLYFSVVDLDEASTLFGEGNVHPHHPDQQQQKGRADEKGALWPLSTLMLLRDEDHMKNGEGLMKSSDPMQNCSMRERISNLVRERTNGKLDLRSTTNNISGATSGMRRILLVTHLMYYGYCFNPVSFFFILKPNPNIIDGEEEIEAIVVEVSNTPWNEMSIYVLHPDSIDTVEHYIYPSESSENKSNIYRYRWRKNFHVSPFMTMDHDYDWKFQVSPDNIKVEAKMIKQKDRSDNADATNNAGDSKKDDGLLFFTAGFDIKRTIKPSATYPLQLARVIMRFPIYCFVIQIWIHYEAIKLLMKGVEFIPHPEGSETGASRAIAAVMRPVFVAMDVLDVWWSRFIGVGKSKSA